MLCFPNCKINIGLYVTGRRDDGYHNLETLFYPVGLQDVLEIVPASATKLHISGLSVAGDLEQNLVWKSFQLLKNLHPDKVAGADIFLHKAIPMGAGLGGGSADGAFMLCLLNDFYGLGYSKGQLASFALELGSDCPFFIYNTPTFAAGRGEQFLDTTLDLSGYTIQLVCPDVHVSTGAAFGMISPRPAPFDLRSLGSLPVDQWKEKVSNDFEKPVFRMHPQLATIKQQLYDQGALYAAMSGSGSAIFAIFSKGKSAAIQGNTTFVL